MNTEGTIYLPSPLATFDGEYVTPTDMIVRALVGRVGRWTEFDGIPVVRDLERVEYPYRRTWVVLGSGSGRVLWDSEANPIDPNQKVLVRVDNSVMRADWYELRYSIHQGWVLDDVYIDDSIEPMDDEGYPRICEDHELTEDQSTLLESLEDDEDEASLGLVDTLPIADYWADDRYLCSEHFDRAFPNQAHFRGYRSGDSLGTWTDYESIENHARETGMATDSEHFNPYSGQTIEVTRADVESWRVGSARVSELATIKANQARETFLGATYRAYVLGTITREKAIESGIAEKYIELGERIKEDRARIKAQ